MLQSYYEKRHYSKNGEDGILEEIFNRLNIYHGWFAEIGTWDGRYLSNSYFLFRKGWRGVYLEGDPEKISRLNKTALQHPGVMFVVPQNVEVSGQNQLDSLLSRTEIPKHFQLLSISIDSFDWWIWNSLQNYQPDVVVIDVNSQYPPGIEYVQPPDFKAKPFNPFFRTSPIHQDLKSGASFTSLVKLGEKKGYKVVSHLIFLTGSLIFVREELAQKLALNGILDHPEWAFNNNWFYQRFRAFMPSLPVRASLKPKLKLILVPVLNFAEKCLKKINNLKSKIRHSVLSLWYLFLRLIPGFVKKPLKPLVHFLRRKLKRRTELAV